jgi:hypothetical protein
MIRLDLERHKLGSFSHRMMGGFYTALETIKIIVKRFSMRNFSIMKKI